MRLIARNHLFMCAALMASILAAGAPGLARAATATWIATSTNDWMIASNWSTGAVPTASDTALFSSSSTVNAVISTSTAVGGMIMSSGYTGTITQASSSVSGTPLTLTIGGGGFSQSGGTFSGSNGQYNDDSITVNGSFTLNNGAFASTDGRLTIASTTATSSATFSASSTFNNNGGIVWFQTSTVVTGSATFYQLWFSPKDGYWFEGTYSYTIATGTVLTTQNYLNLDNDADPLIFYGSGTIDAQGDVPASYQPNVTSYGVTFVLNGSGNQTIGGAPTSSYDACSGSSGCETWLPGVTINKPSGTLFLGGKTVINGNWDNASGTVNAETSTLIMGGVTSTPPIMSGSTSFYDLLFESLNDAWGPTASYVIATGTTLTVNDELGLSPDGSSIQLIGGGTIDVLGNIGGGYECGYATGTVSIVLDGTGNQTVGDDSIYGAGPLNDSLVIPNLTIDKTSGSVVWGSSVSMTWFAGNLTNVNNTPMIPGTSTVSFGDGQYGYLPTSTSATINGSSTFYNLYFNSGGTNNANGYFTIATGTVITVEGETQLNTDYTAVFLLGGGTIDAQGDVYGGYFAEPSTGTVSFVLDGTGAQTIGQNSNGISMYLPNLTVNKASGVAYMTSLVVVTGPVTVQKGELQLGLSPVASSFTASSTMTVDSGAIFSDYATVQSSVIFGSSVTNNGVVWFDGGGNGCPPVPTNIAIQSTQSGTQRAWSGSGTFIMRYVSVQDQGGTAPITVVNGTNVSGVGSNWSFASVVQPQLVQTVTGYASASGGPPNTATTYLTLNFRPRAGDLLVVAASDATGTIEVPTDTIGNAFTVVTSTPLSEPTAGNVAIFYSQNVSTTYSPTSTVIEVYATNSSGPEAVSSAVYEFTGVAQTSTLDAYGANSSSTGAGLSATSLPASSKGTNELYFGAVTTASGTVSSGSQWTSVTAMGSAPDLYTEQMGSTSTLTTSSVWTTSTSTNYGAILAIFESPYANLYPASGTLESAIFDTRDASGTQLNSFVWQGSEPAGTSVSFQFAASNSSNGPWTFYGQNGDTASTFSGPPGTPISLDTATGYTLFSGYRYFRYEVTLYSDKEQQYTPIVTGVSVNWSP